MKRTVMTANLLFVFCCVCFSQAQNWRDKTEKAEFIHRAMREVTDVIVYDIYSPPVASRTYAYVAIAGYEAIIPANKEYMSLAGQLHGLTDLPKPEAGKDISYTLAAVQAILTTGKAMVISEETIDTFQKQIVNEFRADGIPEEVMTNSVQFGQQIAESILAWAAKDKYKETRALPKFSVNDGDPGTWKPTPPVYIKAIEPNWNKMRTFIIDSASQFKPIVPPKFSTDKNSVFYKEATAVYNAGLNQTKEQNEIANFWDCNPFKVNVKGHVMYATKKISPNGHWENITRLVCTKKGSDAVESAAAYACVSVALADCLISCWDEKYRSIVIRPETYINQYISADWVPTLQTPPFPEYTSGHSIVSATASVVLSKMFGDHFSFTDSTESEFGLPPRSFPSFRAAADEAAISRFYGGIHYMAAIKAGIDKGYLLGQFILQNIKMRKDQVANK